MTWIAPSPRGFPCCTLSVLLRARAEQILFLTALLSPRSSSANSLWQRQWLGCGLVQKIEVALIPHAKAEEKVVYDAVIALRDKDAQVDGHEGRRCRP